MPQLRISIFQILQLIKGFPVYFLLLLVFQICHQVIYFIFSTFIFALMKEVGLGFVFQCQVDGLLIDGSINSDFRVLVADLLVLLERDELVEGWLMILGVLIDLRFRLGAILVSDREEQRNVEVLNCGGNLFGIVDDFRPSLPHLLLLLPCGSLILVWDVEGIFICRLGVKRWGLVGGIHWRWREKALLPRSLLRYMLGIVHLFIHVIYLLRNLTVIISILYSNQLPRPLLLPHSFPSARPSIHSPYLLIHMVLHRYCRCYGMARHTSICHFVLNDRWWKHHSPIIAMPPYVIHEFTVCILSIPHRNINKYPILMPYSSIPALEDFTTSIVVGSQPFIFPHIGYWLSLQPIISIEHFKNLSSLFYHILSLFYSVIYKFYTNYSQNI